MKNAVFWNVALCRSCVNRRFGEMYRLHLQGRKIRELGTSVRWLQTRSTRRHILEDGILFESHRFYVTCQNYHETTKRCHLYHHVVETLDASSVIHYTDSKSHSKLNDKQNSAAFNRKRTAVNFPSCYILTVFG
jgi:hypothetical protein